MTTIFRLALTLVLLSGALSEAGAEQPKVVASIFPLHSLAAGVMAGAGAPTLLLEGALTPHDFTLKPSQARLLQAADLLIWVGDGFEVPLARFAENLPPGRSLALAARATPRQNLHLWIDPEQAKRIVSTLVMKLRALDPDHGTLYETNGAALERRIDALERELKALLRPLREVPFIVFHDAYGPFERRFGLNQVGVVSLRPELGPGAARIRRMRAVIAASGARCVFREPQFEPQILSAIVEGSSVRIGELDPLGAGLEAGVNGYFQLMRNLARAFAACLSRP